MCGGAAAQADTLARIKSSGAITIGARDSQIPLSYQPAGSGDPVGFTNDICLKIVDAVKAQLALPGIEVRYGIPTATNRIPLLTSGTVDLDCATTTNTVQRLQQVAFAPRHFVTNTPAAVKKNSGIHTLADLNGKTVSTAAGSTATYILDDVQLAGLIATSPNPDDFKILTGESLRQEPYGIMVRKDDPAFKALVDKSATETMTSGAIHEICAKWFTRPIPPTNANLNFPTTEPVKEIYKGPNSNGV